MKKAKEYDATRREHKPTVAQNLVFSAPPEDAEEELGMLGRAAAVSAKGVSTRSRLGNRGTMTEAGVILSGECGGPRNFLHGRLARPPGYQSPKNTRSILTKLEDMMPTWRGMRTDLKEMALLHGMDHDFTICDFIECLNQDSARRWAEYETEYSAEKELLARGFLFDAWLEVELKALEALDHADPHNDVVRTHDSEGVGYNAERLPASSR